MKTKNTMRAFVLHGAKDLKLEQRPVPVAGPGEVLLKLRAAGICGSDVHYYTHGRCGNFVPTRPFILGHEFSGEVVQLGDRVNGLAVGQAVAVDPSRPCSRCKLCRSGRYNLCPQMVYFGSASVIPPSEGCFSDYVLVPAGNCAPLPDGFKYSWGALLEPLSVAAHAIHRSGGVAGKRVLITGGGTIGQMILKVALTYGASCVVVSDPMPHAREFALKSGAIGVLDPMADTMPAEATNWAPGGFDTAFEASGAAVAANQAIQLAATGGTIVQVGTLEDGVALPMNRLLTKELQYVASWRFANVFQEVIQLVSSGRLNVEPLITRIYPFEKLNEAFIQASSGNGVLKVQISN